MISWIIFIIGTIVSTTIGYLTNIQTFSFWQILLIFIISLLILILLNAICATICCKLLPNKLFAREKKFFTPGKLECKLYVKLGVKHWKDKTAEWGKLNGFSKDKVKDPKDPESLKKFILECNKGYLGHLTSLFIAALLFLCVPKCLILPMAVPMFITSFILNFIPIAILRYNTQRLNSLLRFVERQKIKPEN